MEHALTPTSFTPGVAGIIMLALILVGLPLLAWRTQRSGVALRAPRPALYLSAVLTQWLLFGALVVTLWLDGRALATLGLDAPSAGALAGFAAATLGAALALTLALLWLRRRLGQRESPELRHLIPRTGRERLMFALAVCPTAGFVEECLYRGFVLTRLAPLVGGPVAALSLATAAFAACHFYQGWLGAARAGLLGALLAVPFLLTGSLWPSILAHAALDLLGGLPLGSLLADGDDEAAVA